MTNTSERRLGVRTVAGKSIQGRERNDESSVMCRHAHEKHGGKMPGFKMNVTGVYRNDALMRQIG